MVGRTCRSSSEGQSLILMYSPQGGGWHQRPTPLPQSHHYFANRPMWRNQEYIVIDD